jgi:Ras family protein T1
MVREHAEGGVRDGGLTEAGFLYLHTIFIQRGRLETTWTVLRKFGYGEDLRLTEVFLYPKCVSITRLSQRAWLMSISFRFDVPYDCSVELSQQGYQFFTNIFETFDKVR